MEWEQQDSVPAPRQRSPLARGMIIGLQRLASGVARHWLALVNSFWGLLLLGALLAPTFMALGWEGAGRVTYAIYSFTCHQLPERSYFLFAPDTSFQMYEKPALVAAGADATNLLTLRNYVGSPEMGWKAGFSDRMFSMYGGAFLAGIVFWLLSKRGRVNPLPVWLLILLIIPMGLDGGTHFLSEILFPNGDGFRETNAWAMPFFPGQPMEFFTGTTFGTLNSHLRFITGLLFGMGMMLFAYPLMAYSFDDLAEEAERTLDRNLARVREMEQAS
jgi:uncharacterized membrane protein